RRRGKIERPRPADIGREMVVHLGLKARIGLRLGVGLLEVEDQRHQGFGDETPAIEAEMAAVVRPRALVIQRRAHEAIASGVPAADFAARINFSMRSPSLRPGARSTPEDTSTMAA